MEAIFITSATFSSHFFQSTLKNNLSLLFSKYLFWNTKPPASNKLCKQAEKESKRRRPKPCTAVREEVLQKIITRMSYLSYANRSIPKKNNHCSKTLELSKVLFVTLRRRIDFFSVFLHLNNYSNKFSHK